MEDDHVACALRSARHPGCRFFGLYDGHGGREAVDFVTAHLHKLVEREMCESPVPETELQQPIRRAFLKLDRMLQQMGTYNCGTTAAVCVCCRGSSDVPMTLHVANVGDSRCVLIAEHGARRLTVDHLATDETEALRVQRDGGQIIGRRVGGTLALTRALGDHALKGTGGGVSAEPHYVSHRVAPSDRFMLLASDGVWDVVDDDEAHRQLTSASTESVEDLARRIVSLALERGTRDNVSALVVRLTV